MTIDEQKAELNKKSEKAMRVYLRSLTWPEKVRSIERMRAASKIAREAMRNALHNGKSEPATSKASALGLHEQ